MEIICYCHLRWNFVYQRPQHLMSRFAQQGRVFIVEEPVFDAEISYLEKTAKDENLQILVPHLPVGLSEKEIINEQQLLLSSWFLASGIQQYIAWYYTAMMLPLGESLPSAELIVYDCMDELSAFKNAPATIKEKEKQLLEKADLVFTGGYSLYEAKKHLHHNIHPFPSSIDKAHFSKARNITSEPADQAAIPHPRIGFFGVIDERMNIDLLHQIAVARPDWHLVVIGPVVKIDPATLPTAPNIHYMGSRSYDELPAYLSGWDTALIPFALNESTQFISPTKTPEYLAGGVPVVSTSIQDVVNPYADEELVFIADTAEDFIVGIECSFNLRNNVQWLKEVDDFLSNTSWDITWNGMMTLINNKLDSHTTSDPVKKNNEYV
jgi:glycosyltransferase involved in cell wall biosynthesis